MGIGTDKTAAVLGKSICGCSLQKIGISDSSYSAIKSGTYNGDVDKQMKKVIEYFETKQAAAEIYVGTDYKETSISSNVYKIIRNCQLQGGLAIACGDAGIGKHRLAGSITVSTAQTVHT